VFGPGVQAGTTAEAVKADIVLLSIPWVDVADALRNVPAWNGQILIDATNAISFTNFKPFDLGDKTSSELVAGLAPGARIVKAFNTLAAGTLAADPSEGGGQRVIFLSGDDAAAKAEVLKLIEALGFAGIDLGGLAAGGQLQQFAGALAAKNLIRLPN
jgi:predicted dinucleotide-binding enzyme